jgi:hAT family C-terminal dimerisation region
MRRITSAGLMTLSQYANAEEELVARLQWMREQECGHVEVIQSSGTSDDDSLDDPVIRKVSSERERARDEFRTYCNIVKLMRYTPKSFAGNTLDLGTIKMGKVEERGDDIRASPPFITCNLADYIEDSGRFDLVNFLKLNRATFPTIFKLAVCLASIRTNEVGCERFFSTAGYVSCPRRTSLKVRNYECRLSTLKANMKNVFIDDRWVVNQYQLMEQKKSWTDLDTDDDLRVLNLEREMQAEIWGVPVETLPLVDHSDSTSKPVEVIEIADNPTVLTT